MKSTQNFNRFSYFSYFEYNFSYNGVIKNFKTPSRKILHLKKRKYNFVQISNLIQCKKCSIYPIHYDLHSRNSVKNFNHRLKIKNYRTNIMSHCTYNKQDY